MEYSNLFVCLMGILTVFIGLVCIIVLVSVMSAIVNKTDKVMSKAVKETPGTAVATLGSSKTQEVTPELIAAISAVIAEEMGTDVSAIRITSLKRV